MPSATATPQPRGVFWNINVKIYFIWEIGIKSGGKRVRKKAVRFHLINNYGQLRRGKVPSLQKSSPFLGSSFSPSVTELAEVQGLHSLFACLRTIPPSVVFFLSHFLQSTLHSQCCFFKTTVSFHPQEQKDAVHSNRHHHARLHQKRNNSKLLKDQAPTEERQVFNSTKH